MIKYKSTVENLVDMHELVSYKKKYNHYDRYETTVCLSFTVMKLCICSNSKKNYGEEIK